MCVHRFDTVGPAVEWIPDPLERILLNQEARCNHFTVDINLSHVSGVLVICTTILLRKERK